MIAPGDIESNSQRSVAPSGDELTAQYRAYRRRQAARLVHLMPREAVRPLVRRAREEGFGQTDDPLGMLVTYCESLLPLPSFDLWCRDVLLNPDEHLIELGEGAAAPTVDAPATLDAAKVDHFGTTWLAHLRTFCENGAWKGYIAFEDTTSGDVHRTAMVFHGSDPSEVRSRFRSFESDALVSFLRSALP